MSNDQETNVRNRLRAADPAAGAPMTGAERERLRAGLLGAVAGQREAAPAPGGLRPAWTGLAAAVLLAAIALWVSRAPAPTPRAPEDPGPAAVPVLDTLAPRHSLAPRLDTLRPRTPLPGAGRPDLPARRTIHFTAPRGTRLVWVVPEHRPGAG